MFVIPQGSALAVVVAVVVVVVVAVAVAVALSLALVVAVSVVLAVVLAVALEIERGFSLASKPSHKAPPLCRRPERKAKPKRLNIAVAFAVVFCCCRCLYLLFVIPQGFAYVLAPTRPPKPVNPQTIQTPRQPRTFA